MQGQDEMAKGLVGNVRVRLRGRQGAVLREHLQVHARGEMLAGRRNHDDPRTRIVVDVAHDGRQRTPELAIHGVESVRPVELQMRDAVGDGDIENALSRAGALSVHAGLPGLRYPHPTQHHAAR